VLIELDPVDRITAGAVGEPGQRTFFLQGRKGQQLVTLLVEKQQVQLLAASVVEILARVGKDTGQGPPEESMGLEQPLVAEWRVGRLSIGYQEERDLLMLEAAEVHPEPDEPESDDGPEREDRGPEPGEPPGAAVQAALEEQFGVYTVEAILGDPTEEEEEAIEEGLEPSPTDEPDRPDGHSGTGERGVGDQGGERMPRGRAFTDQGEENRVRFWATREQMLSLAKHATAVCAAGRPRCPLCGTAMDPEGHTCPALNGHRPVDTQ
jgi:uncharacterized repeat protein (TIGR03847 family)